MNKLFRHFLFVLLPVLSVLVISCDDDTEEILAPDITAVSPTEALPGTQVTITGVNLANATSIMFGNTAATATNNTATSITTTVPATITAGSQQIKVVTAGGSDTFAFTVLEEVDETATITAVNPTTGGPGTVVVISGTNLAGVTTLRIGETEITGFEVNEAGDAITFTVPEDATAETFTGNFAVTTPEGDFESPDDVMFTFEEEAAEATITAVEPIAGGVGTEVTITGANFTGATALRIGDTEITGFEVNEAGDAITFTVPETATAENFTGRFTVVTPAGEITSAETVMFTFEEGDTGEMSVALTADDAYVISGFGESILLTADVEGGNVARVVFMQGETQLAELTEGPFTHQFEVGDDAAAYTNYTIMARAYDAEDNMVESEAVVIRVGERFAIGAGTLTGVIETDPNNEFVERWNIIDPAVSPELVTPPFPEDGRYPGYLNWSGDGDLEAASGVNLPVSVPEAGQYLVSLGLASGFADEESFMMFYFDENVDNAQRTPEVPPTGWEAFEDYLIENPYELTAGEHVAKVRFGGPFVHPYYVDLYKF